MAHADRVSKDFCLRTDRKPYYYTKKRKEVKRFSGKSAPFFWKNCKFPEISSGKRAASLAIGRKFV